MRIRIHLRAISLAVPVLSNVDMPMWGCDARPTATQRPRINFVALFLFVRTPNYFVAWIDGQSYGGKLQRATLYYQTKGELYA